jgi:hypothetical protein
VSHLPNQLRPEFADRRESRIDIGDLERNMPNRRACIDRRNGVTERNQLEHMTRAGAPKLREVASKPIDAGDPLDQVGHPTRLKDEL